MWILAAILLAVNAQDDVLTLKEILPFMGPTKGNTRVSVWVDGISSNANYPNAKCRFGSDVVHAIKGKCTPKPKGVDDPDPKTDDLTLPCIMCDPSPPHEGDEIVKFMVSVTGDFSDSQEYLDFEYYEEATVTNFFPTYGHRNGGTVVKVEGTGFRDHREYLRCSVGTKEVQGIFISESMIHCVMPPSDTVIAAMPFRILMNDIQWAAHVDPSHPMAYYYYPQPQIYNLVPNRGPLDGGNEVRIEGFDLDPFNDMPRVDNHADVFVRFGESNLVKGTVISDTIISCVAPASLDVSTVLVDITLNNADEDLNAGDWTDDYLPYHYFTMSFLFDIEPRVGPVSGGTTVIIFGSNFTEKGTFSVKFGEKVVAAEYIGGNTVRCVSPDQSSAGYYDLSVASYADEFGEAVQFLYYDSPLIDSIGPACGPITGYTQISIKGRNFSVTEQKLVQCFFDDIALPATVLSSDEILCSSPDISGDPDLINKGVFSVAVTLNGKDKSESDSPINFSYYDTHSLSSLEQTRGPTVGGTYVEVNGEGFAQKGVCNVRARFGTQDVEATVNSDGNLSCTSPEVHVPGIALLQVALNGQQYYESEGFQAADGKALEFEYYIQPLVTHFTPKAGPSSGNSEMYIYGNGFMGKNETESNTDIWVQFTDKDSGQLYGTVTVDSIGLNELKLRTPAGTPAANAKLSISKNNENFVEIRNVGKTESDDYFSYYNAPHVQSIEPSYGPVSQPDREVTIRGQNFICPDDNCDQLFARFDVGDLPIMVKAEHISDEELRCIIPSLSRPDTVPVEVSTNGYDWTQDGVPYSYYDAFVLGIEPRAGKFGGDTDINVHGYGFANTKDELKCRFGSEKNPLVCGEDGDCIFPAEYVDDTLVKCKSPPADSVTYKDSGEPIGKGPVDVEIAVHDDEFTNNGIQFEYYNEPKLQPPNITDSTVDGGGLVVIPLDFDGDGDFGDESIIGPDGQTDLSKLEGLIKPVIRFTSPDGKITKDVEAELVHYPPGTAGPPNAMAVHAPEWDKPGDAKISIALNGEDFEGDFDYKFTETISHDSIFPKAGPVTGETPVKITGSGFGSIDNCVVRFGADLQKVHPDAVKSDCIDTMSTPTPQSKTHGGIAHVTVGNLLDDSDVAGNFSKDNVEFLYYKVPIVSLIAPHSGSNAGGNTVDVEGAWFSYNPDFGVWPRLKFGDIAVDCEFINTVRTRCPVPGENKVIGKLDVFMSLNGANWHPTEHSYTFYNAPKVTSNHPTSGPTEGGTIIEMHGSNFVDEGDDGAFNCKFSLVDDPSTFKIVPAHFQSDKVVICMSPGGWDEGAEADIGVTMNGSDYTYGDTKFNFFQVDGIYPMSAPIEHADGLVLTVYGSGFKPNKDTRLFLDHDGAAPFDVQPHEMKFKMPKQNEDELGLILDLDLTMNGVDFQSFPEGFEFYGKPTINGVSPERGPLGGLDPISISADLYQDHMPGFNGTCKVGEHIGILKIVDQQNANCVLPKEGDVAETDLPISVSMNGVDYTDPADFKYSTYGLLDIAPKQGPIRGGTQVVVAGFGFDVPEGYKTYCRFGIKSDFIVVDAEVVDPEHMICISPTDFKIPSTTELPLDVPLEIGFAQEGENIPWTNSDNKFRFYQNPAVTALSPAGCSVEDEVEVLITAKGKNNFFQAITGMTTAGEADLAHAMVCQFGDYGVTPATYVDPDTIKCMSPRTGLEADAVGKISLDIKLSLNSQDFYRAGSFFLYGTDDGWWILMIWLGCISCVVTIFALCSCCCYYAFHRSKLTLEDASRHSSRQHSNHSRGSEVLPDQDIQNRGGRQAGGNAVNRPAPDANRGQDQDSSARGGFMDAGSRGNSGPGSRQDSQGDRPKPPAAAPPAAAAPPVASQQAGSRAASNAGSHAASNAGSRAASNAGSRAASNAGSRNSGAGSRDDHGNGSHHSGSHHSGSHHSKSHGSSSSSSSSSSDEE